MSLPQSATESIRSGALGHLVTELLQELARVYLAPNVRFPAMDDPPPGVRMRIAVERVGGVGPWAD
jgi:hypothetical protein